MKRIHFSLLLAIIAVAGMGITSCTSDLTPSIEPADGFIGENTTDSIQQDINSGDISELSENDIASDVAGDIAQDTGYQPPKPELSAWLQAILDEYITFTGEPGASLTIKMPENVRFSGAAGLADLNKKTPVSPDSAFRTGSTTKPFVAVVVLQLVDEGKLILDGQLGDILPEYPKWKSITVRDLLDMKSGIPDYIGEQALWLKTIGHPDKPVTPAELLAYVKDKPLQFQPGQGCGYSDSNYILLGMIIEKVTGNTAAKEIDTRIVKQLGLKHTYLETGNEHDTSLVHGYIHPKQAFMMLGLPAAAIGLIPKDLFIENDLIDSTNLFPPSIVWTAGGLVTTTQDTVVFMKTLLDGGLMSPESLKAMTTFGACTILGEGVNYGLGLIGYDTPLGMAYGHGGMVYGYTASTNYVPDADIAISHMHNSLPEQSTYLDWEVMRLALVTPKQPPSVCGLPTAMSVAPPSPGITLRFKGVINPDKINAPKQGLSNIRLLLDNKWNPLYGIFSSAKVTTDQYSTRLEIDSYGPPVTNKSSLSGAIISVDKKAVARIDANGVLTFDKTSPYDIVAFTQDIWMNNTTHQANKICITGVLDRAKTSTLYFCDKDSLDFSQNKDIKVFGKFAITMQASDIKAYLSPVGIARCNCADNNGKWSPCE